MITALPAVEFLHVLQLYIPFASASETIGRLLAVGPRELQGQEATKSVTQCLGLRLQLWLASAKGDGRLPCEQSTEQVGDSFGGRVVRKALFTFSQQLDLCS